MDEESAYIEYFIDEQLNEVLEQGVSIPKVKSVTYKNARVSNVKNQ